MGDAAYGWYVPSSIPAFTDSNQYRALEEHHIDNFDPGAFFQLHDFDGDGYWDESEILKTYGMEDESAKDVPQEKKDEIINEIMLLMDKNGNKVVERWEWDEYTRAGKELPDFGLGPGHHWDMEMEYEIHHWERLVHQLNWRYGSHEG